ncbi:MAG: DUF4286 family protein [Saprospiraceae bacterium]|jgi:hypothetical protein
MILYNVTVQIDHDIQDDWISWMQTIHIPDVMNTGLFSSWRMCKILGQEENPTGVSYAIQYTCASMKDFIRYRDHFAADLQKEHSTRYAGKYAAFRTLLEVIDSGYSEQPLTD